MFSDLTFGNFDKLWGFSKLMEFLWYFWDGFCIFDLKTSCIASYVHYNTASCILDVCLHCWNDCVLVGLYWAKPMMSLLSHITCSCICMHTYLPFFIFWYIDCVGTFLIISLFLPISFFRLVASWHLNENIFHPGTLFVPGHPPLLILFPHIFGSMMIKPDRNFRRTFLDEVFIQNAESFCRTSSTLTYWWLA